MGIIKVLLETRQFDGTTSASCIESLFPDGSRCVEVRALRTTPPRTRSVCSTTGAQALFTDLRTTDRTGARRTSWG